MASRGTGSGGRGRGGREGGGERGEPRRGGGEPRGPPGVGGPGIVGGRERCIDGRRREGRERVGRSERRAERVAERGRRTEKGAARAGTSRYVREGALPRVGRESSMRGLRERGRTGTREVAGISERGLGGRVGGVGL